MKVYQDVNFGGGELDITGDTPDLRTAGDWNDRVSSVRLDPGQTATLYENINYDGQQLTLTADAPDLRAFPGPGAGGTWNDVASSIKVTGAASGGGTPSGAVKLKRGGAYVSNGDPFVLTQHDGGTFDARNTNRNTQLAIENNGTIGERPAGTAVAETQLQVRATTQPNGTSILYREDGTRVFGEPLIIEAIQ